MRAATPRRCWPWPGTTPADGRGAKDMVVLPYKDRLALFSRYLQQLVMESLGKELDLDGNVVHQGIAVYGNKGSTDQHAYVQQLRDGVPNFFVTFIEVLRDREGPSIEVDAGVTAGDYLHGFLLGTRRALYENGRPSLTITVDEVDPRTVGLLDRAVRARRRPLRLAGQHQRLPPARRRGRQEGRGVGARPAAPAARGTGAARRRGRDLRGAGRGRGRRRRRGNRVQGAGTAVDQPGSRRAAFGGHNAVRGGLPPG